MDIQPSFLPILLHRPQQDTLQILLLLCRTACGHSLRHGTKYRDFHMPQFLFPLTVKECTKVWQNSTSNSSADRLWQPCLKVGLSKSGSVALIHYCMLKGKERCLKRQKNPTASLSVNTLKLFSATAIQPSLFQKITTLNTFYKHRVELHLQDYSESHCWVVLEEALKA